jgi:hypothetical protein
MRGWGAAMAKGYEQGRRQRGGDKRTGDASEEKGEGRELKGEAER